MELGDGDPIVSYIDRNEQFKNFYSQYTREASEENRQNLREAMGETLNYFYCQAMSSQSDYLAEQVVLKTYIFKQICYNDSPATLQKYYWLIYHILGMEKII